MRTKEQHRIYMRQWRAKKKQAQNPQNSPELPVSVDRVPSNGIKTLKTYQNLNQNCDTSISPEKRFFNLCMFHPVRKNRIYLSECSGKTIISLKSQGFEVEK